MARHGATLAGGISVPVAKGRGGVPSTSQFYVCRVGNLLVGGYFRGLSKSGFLKLRRDLQPIQNQVVLCLVANAIQWETVSSALEATHPRMQFTRLVPLRELWAHERQGGREGGRPRNYTDL